jgi:hypothetical protein
MALSFDRVDPKDVRHGFVPTNDGDFSYGARDYWAAALELVVVT